MAVNSESRILIEEIEGDVLTPISVYQKISGTKKFLLESSLKHEHSGRFSFIGSSPVFELKSRDGCTFKKDSMGERQLAGNFLDVLSAEMPKLDSELDIPFIGGAVGYMGYDMIRNFEHIGVELPDDLDMPDAHLMFFEEIIIFDHVKQKIYLIGIPFGDTHSTEALRGRLEKRKAEINGEATNPAEADFRLSTFHDQIARDKYEQMVVKAKEYIEAGDIFQVVLSRRLSAEASGNPFSFYRKLRVQNPSPYMYYLDFEEYVIAGASPESLVKSKQRTITTNPIAGTRPRGTSEQEDLRNEADLKSDDKELAEHRMLLDLGRNDIGRVSAPGSVRINKHMQVERYKHVMHLVSEVSGNLTPGTEPIEGLVACLPAGTVSGAPKIRAMQIINELEGVKRGVYSGAVGYYSASGNMDFALVIRTMIVKDGKAYIQAGAGIVHDSVPAMEFDETVHKLKALMEVSYDSVNR
ncbi:anthranilate synthase component I [Bacillus sp. T33-2]|uniref:anthranilate synthase component I n=1 Tax=Bacillus sp. T33-2 TaxID=2054168 RepID=UPI000C763BE2|nr:anthranilate synthase component I [Bacillus sp. T33-2]PLR98817.1 anthranilate synthase component I [Bacillus sp. T33-2]